MATNAPLTLYRILFGLLMLVESWGAIATGWVNSAFVEPRWTFPLRGFEALRVLSGPWMLGYFAAMGCAALGVTLGWRYRWSAATLAVLWTGAYLAQKSHYNNHYYLAVILCWLMAFLPAHRDRSLDVRSGRVQRQVTCPAWIHRVFRVQLLIVFTYAAVNKFYPGWLNGDYLRLNLGSKGDRWPLGALVVKPWFQTFTIYAAIVFDAVVIPCLMIKRTRWWAFAGLVGFNLFNSIVFRIGIFPYMVIATTVFFFVDLFRSTPPGEESVAGGDPLRGLHVAVGVLMAVQLVLPLRHHLIPGDVTWTEEGHRMSWRMMLRSKSGVIMLDAKDGASGRRWTVPLQKFVGPRQLSRVAVNPEFLYQLVQILKEHYRAEGVSELELRAGYSAVSLNGNPAAPLYDPAVDLTRVRWSFLGRDDWVLDAPRAPK